MPKMALRWIGTAAMAIAATACADLQPQTGPAPSSAASQPSAAVNSNGEPILPKCQRSGDQFRVLANVEWCDTGLRVASTDTLSIQAAGIWSNQGAPAVGPEGHPSGYQGTLLDRAPLAALIAEVGFRMFKVGASYNGPAGDTGRLLLSMNDLPGTFNDNAGFVSVRIKVGAN